jgi:hypothetical protein
LSLGDLKFHFAFTVTSKDNDKTTKEIMHDGNYVEWYTTMKVYDELGNKTRIPLTNHVFKEQDFEKFYPALERQKGTIDFFRKNNAFICLDHIQKDKKGKSYKLDDLKLFGSNRAN